MRTISARLPAGLLARLENEAKARRATKSAVVRQSLELALRKQPKTGSVSCYDLASDLAGSIKGLPGDLATNPRYLTDLGR